MPTRDSQKVGSVFLVKLDPPETVEYSSQLRDRQKRYFRGGPTGRPTVVGSTLGLTRNHYIGREFQVTKQSTKRRQRPAAPLAIRELIVNHDDAASPGFQDPVDLFEGLHNASCMVQTSDRDHEVEALRYQREVQGASAGARSADAAEAQPMLHHPDGLFGDVQPEVLCAAFSDCCPRLP